MFSNNTEAIKELGEIINSFEDLSDSEEERADFYLDRLTKVYDTLVVKTAEEYYNKEGVSGVQEFVEDLGIDIYHYCTHCDTDTPQFKGSCLFCGQ